MRTIICSVGTSLLGNYRRSAEGSPNVENLVRFARQTGSAKASAELNALERLQPTPADRLVFLHSDTADGALCAQALCGYAATQWESATAATSIEGLTDDAAKFQGGLRNFTDLTVREVLNARKQSREPIINANGGFKAQTAMAVAVGLILQVRVVYVHQEFDMLVDMPALPIGWDWPSFVAAENLMLRLEQGLPAHEFDRLLLGYGPDIQETVRNLSERVGDEVTVNSLGLALLKAYGHAINQDPGQDVWLSDNASAKLQAIDGSETGDIARGVLARLAHPQVRARAERKHNSDCSFFPQRRSPIRVAFFEDDEERVVIAEIFDQHGDYERALDSRRIFRRFYQADVKFE